jgi:Peptidase family M48
MSSKSRRSLVASILVIALMAPMLIPAVAAARGKGPSSVAPPDQDKKDKNKGDKNDQPKTSKEERQYQKIKTFSLNLYEKDADFREAVEEAYRDTMRKHAQQAYLINTRRTDGKLVTRDGDKIIMEDMLYDNPLAQDYVNRVGQSLVPNGSNKLYAFKITLNPVPDARALSTGTVYVSSGLLSAVDNEAQLAYVLGHEIGHVEKEHWKEDVLVDHGLTEYNKNQQKKQAWLGLGMQAGLGIFGASGGANSAGGAIALLAAYATVPTVAKLAYPTMSVSWDKQQEDQADELGLKYMLSRNYDPREVPNFYANLKALALKDPRVRSGFMAHGARIDERTQMVASVLTNIAATGSLTSGLVAGSVNLAMQKANSATATAPRQPIGDGSKGLDPTKDAERRAGSAGKTIGELSATIKEKLDAGELIGTTAEFEAIMAALTRDNGITAYYFDMFQMARDDLEESLRIRSNDPYAHFYYGKVLKLTARTTQEKLKALSEFASAVQYDKRGVLAEPHLYQALSMIDNPNTSDTKEIVDNLKQYVVIYQREHAGGLPGNIDAIYDYMQNVGEMAWSATPAMNVSTRNIEPIGIRQDNGRPQSVPAETSEPAPVKQPPARRRP